MKHQLELVILVAVGAISKNNNGEEGYFDSLAINTIWISPLVDQAKGAWGLWKTPRSKSNNKNEFVGGVENQVMPQKNFYTLICD